MSAVHRLALVLAAVALVLTLPASASAASRICRGATVDPAVKPGAAKRATLCLLNQERRARGLGALRSKRTLTRVARRYAAHMQRRDFFSHVSPDGQTSAARCAVSGFLKSEPGWTCGENLGWGTRGGETPRAMVRAWMGSPGHRANILRPAYRTVGIGIAKGTPVADEPRGNTYVTQFAS